MRKKQKKYTVYGLTPLNGYRRFGTYHAYSEDHAVSIAINVIAEAKDMPSVLISSVKIPDFFICGVISEEDGKNMTPFFDEVKK